MTAAQLALQLEPEVDRYSAPMHSRGDWRKIMYRSKYPVHVFANKAVRPQRSSWSAEEFADRVLGGLSWTDEIANYSVAWPLLWSLRIYWWYDDRPGFSHGLAMKWWPDAPASRAQARAQLIEACQWEGLRVSACVAPVGHRPDRLSAYHLPWAVRDLKAARRGTAWCWCCHRELLLPGAGFHQYAGGDLLSTALGALQAAGWNSRQDGWGYWSHYCPQCTTEHAEVAEQ